MTYLRILFHALHGVILALGAAIEAHAALVTAKADAWATDVWQDGYAAGHDDAVAMLHESGRLRQSIWDEGSDSS